MLERVGGSYMLVSGYFKYLVEFFANNGLIDLEEGYEQ